jgi:hypothetical protein
MFGQAIVPTDKGSGRVDMRPVFALQSDLAIFGRAIGEDDCIVVFGEKGKWQIVAQVDISHKGVIRGRSKSFERVLTVLEGLALCCMSSMGAHLHLRMVRSNPKSDQAKRHRQLLIHVHFGAMDVSHQLLSCVEAGRARADDGHTRTKSTSMSMSIVACAIKPSFRECCHRTLIVHAKLRSAS